MNNTNLIGVILLLILIGAGAFFAGTKYQQSKQSSGRFTSQRNGPGGANRSGFRPVSGDILKSDDGSITVKLADGSSKIVLFTDKTVINKADKAMISDLKAGEKVAVFGQENSDGSITAQNIQLNPAARPAQDQIGL